VVGCPGVHVDDVHGDWVDEGFAGGFFHVLAAGTAIFDGETGEVDDDGVGVVAFARRVEAVLKAGSAGG